MASILIIQCPKCGHVNQASAMNCDRCHINLAWALANREHVHEQSQEEHSDGNALPAPERESTHAPGEMQSQTMVVTSADNTASDHTLMLKEIRSWGMWSLVLGAVHILAAGFFSAPWGILLLIVGLASFYFRTASMFIIYTVILVWVAFSNALSGLGGWMFFALLQLYWALRVFQQFRRFRQVEIKLVEPTADPANDNTSVVKRSEQFFPWIGSLLSCSSIVGILILFAALILMEWRGETTTFLQPWAFMVDLMMNVGVLGFAVGLASLLSGYRPKLLAITGLVVGLLIMILNLALLFLLRAA